MTYTFQQLREDVLRDAHTSTEYFGEEIRYKASDLGELTFDAHCKHSNRFTSDDEGNEILVEMLTVTIPRESLSRAPQRNDVVYRAGDDKGYVYQYGGGDQPHYWRRVYERTIELSRG